MSTVFEQMKEEAQRVKEKKEQQESNFQSLDWFKPRTGVNHIRVMPHWTDPGKKLFFKEIRIHFNIEIMKDDGSGTIPIPARCLREFGEECPVCDEYEGGDKAKKEKMADVRPQTKYLYNIYFIPERKLYPYMAPSTVHGGFFEWVDDIGGDISDLDTGRDWKLEKTVEAGKSPMMGTSYSVRPSFDPSAFPAKFRKYKDPKDASAEEKPILEALIDFDELYTEHHTAAMYKMVGKTPPGKTATSSAPSTSASPASSSTSSSKTKEDDPWKEKVPADEPKIEDDIPFDNSSSDGESAKSNDDKDSPWTEPELQPKDVGIDIEDDTLEQELKELGLD